MTLTQHSTYRHSFLVLVVEFLVAIIIARCNCDKILENGSTKSLAWITNTSLGLTDKMRTYGAGFHLTPEEETALDKVRNLLGV